METTHDTTATEVTKPQPGNRARGTREVVVIDPTLLDYEMDLTHTSNVMLADATDYTRSYVCKVRNGITRRVSREFLARADAYLLARRRPGALAEAVIVGSE